MPIQPQPVIAHSTSIAIVTATATTIVGTTYIQCGLRSRTISSPSFSRFFGYGTSRTLPPVPHAQPSSSRRSSSMPKWCATSWITVHADLVDDLGLGPAHRADRQSVDRDAVGHHHPGVARVPRRERHALVAPEEVGLARSVLHEHRHVVHAVAELGRDAVERLGHELLEAFRRHQHAGTLPTGLSPRGSSTSFLTRLSTA